jgi:hypothetical protein
VAHKKGPSKGPFVLKQKSLAQPGLNSRGAVFCFPLFQRFVIAAFGFDDFASVRIFVDLHLARLKVAVMDKTAGARRRPILWIEQVDHILRMATTPPTKLQI